MATKVEVLEERLKSSLFQLQAESGILDRIIYKNKNQHRRCSYFQYLLKVRRDLKLFHSIHMEELLDSCFNIITGRKAKQKAHLLESLKRKRCDSGKFNFMERLQGVARLLSEMVEPMLKTAIEISTLLARSFFMGFSLMVLALLARLRVLIQQMLLDVVSVFNEVSSLSQKKQSIKITQDGIEVFREYYPTVEGVVSLECVWKTDKFVLVETFGTGNITHQSGSSEAGQTHQNWSLEAGQTLGKSIQYRSIEAFLGDDELDSKEDDADNNGGETISSGTRKRPESPANLANQTNHGERVQILAPEDGLRNVMPPSENITVGGSSLASSSTFPILSSVKSPSTSNKRVAFISVKKPAVPSTTSAAVFQANESENKQHNDKENPLLNLFSEEDAKGSIF